jgi:hypothetical protein
VQWQSSFSGLALQPFVHRPSARARPNPTGRDVGVNLERQLDDVKPVAHEECRSLLADVAERAHEVVPLQHRPRIIDLRSVVVCTHLRRAHSVLSESITAAATAIQNIPPIHAWPGTLTPEPTTSQTLLQNRAEFRCLSSANYASATSEPLFACGSAGSAGAFTGYRSADRDICVHIQSATESLTFPRRPVCTTETLHGS